MTLGYLRKVVRFLEQAHAGGVAQRRSPRRARRAGRRRACLDQPRAGADASRPSSPGRL